MSAWQSATGVGGLHDKGTGLKWKTENVYGEMGWGRRDFRREMTKARQVESSVTCNRTALLLDNVLMWVVWEGQGGVTHKKRDVLVSCDGDLKRREPVEVNRPDGISVLVFWDGWMWGRIPLCRIGIVLETIFRCSDNLTIMPFALCALEVQ